MKVKGPKSERKQVGYKYKAHATLLRGEQPSAYTLHEFTFLFQFTPIQGDT